MGFFMRIFTSPRTRGVVMFVLAFLAAAEPQSTEAVSCENIYKDFSDCVLELGESMDNYQENVTSERGVAAVCSHWEAFHTCALTALSDCQQEVSSIWESLRQDSRRMSFQGSLFELCSPSSAPGGGPGAALRPLLLPGTLLGTLVLTTARWPFI